MFSFWEKQSFIKSPDVTIIGSGIVGLSAALSVKSQSPHLHVIILERGMLPYGASTRNAGFACYGSASELLQDLSYHSEEEVFSLVEKRYRGLQKLRALVGDKNLEYEPLGGYELFYRTDEKLFYECTKLLPLLNSHLETISGDKNVYSVADQKINEFGFNNTAHLIFNSGEGQINTGEMMKSLLMKAKEAGVEILNGAVVRSFNPFKNGVEINIDAINNSGETDLILTRKLLIATNGFASSFLPELDVAPARAQVLITKPISGLKILGTFHIDHGYYYFRNVGNRLLFGGGRNLDFEKENTPEFIVNESIHSKLENIISTVILPSEKFEIEMRWTGIMGLGKDKSPIVKEVAENIFCAVRLGGMGIAIGNLTGEEAAGLILTSLT